MKVPHPATSRDRMSLNRQPGTVKPLAYASGPVDSSDDGESYDEGSLIRPLPVIG